MGRSQGHLQLSLWLLQERHKCSMGSRERARTKERLAGAKILPTTWKNLLKFSGSEPKLPGFLGVQGLTSSPSQPFALQPGSRRRFPPLACPGPCCSPLERPLLSCPHARSHRSSRTQLRVPPLQIHLPQSQEGLAITINVCCDYF